MDGWILGPIGHREYPKVPEAINPHPILRKHFDLFANVRPTRSYPGIGCLHDDVDLVIDEAAGVIRFRSASRTGHWDLGANRRRMEELRRRFLDD